MQELMDIGGLGQRKIVRSHTSDTSRQTIALKDKFGAVMTTKGAGIQFVASEMQID